MHVKASVYIKCKLLFSYYALSISLSPPLTSLPMHRDALLELSECIHTTVIKDMCADCGADLRQNDNVSVISKRSRKVEFCIVFIIQ